MTIEPPSPSIPVIILAAGQSARMRAAGMDTPKQLLPFRGTTLLRHAVETAEAAALGPLTVVLGAHADLIRPVLDGLSAHLIVNPTWQAGMGSSLRAGIAAALARMPSADALLLMLCDQPLITAGNLLALGEKYRVMRKPLIAAAYEGTVGVPALIGRPYFSLASALPDDAGAKALLLRHAHDLATLDLPAAGVDVDDPSAYAFLLKQEKQRLQAEAELRDPRTHEDESSPPPPPVTPSP
jgi:molybdenum cofactor cytidylyltransferase